MLFKPRSSKLWDTFILPHKGKYYLFYLEGRSVCWDGYGLAISEDLIHWEDQGTVIEHGPGIGTGMVYRAGERWILNYCTLDKERSMVHFAESSDLLKWNKLPESTDFYADARWYEDKASESSTGARWHDMWVVSLEDGTFLSFLTANSKNAPPGVNGVAGMASSRDGIHWEAKPPASIPCGIPWAEVNCYVRFGSRHYLLMGGGSNQGPRFDKVYSYYGKSGGVYVMQSASITGPYGLIKGDALLLGCRNAPAEGPYIPVYYTRAFRVGGETLICHHWLSRSDFSDAWLGTVKLLKEVAPGRLILEYWTGNEKLKGDKVFDLKKDLPLLTPSPFSVPNALWEHKGGGIVGKISGSSIAYFEKDLPFNDGIFIEMDMNVSGEGAGGIFFGSEGQGRQNPYNGVACLVNNCGFYEFGSVDAGPCGPSFKVENCITLDIEQHGNNKLRILLRGEFVEVYWNGKFIQCWGFSRRPFHNIGVFAENSEINLKQLDVYEFS